MRTFAATCAALLALITGCSDRPEPAPPAPAAEPDPATVVHSLLLPEDVTVANQLVKKGEPVEGVGKLIDCPDLSSAGQAAAGITASWTWSHGSQQATVTQYNAVYRGITGKDVVKQARAASSCHCGHGEGGISPLDLDEYFYGGDDLGFTKPFVDDRYSYCLRNYPRDHIICTAVQAKGDKVVRITIDITGRTTDLKSPKSSDFAQAVTDRLVA